MRDIIKILAIVKKDLRIEIRSKELFGSMLLFAFLTIVMMGFAFNIKEALIMEILPGLFWIVFLFSGVLGLGKSFANERQNECINALNLASENTLIIFWGKFISNFIFLLFIEIIILLSFIIFFNINLNFSFMLLVVIILGTLGFSSVGTFLAALTSFTRNSEILFPVILFPLLVPLFLGLVQMTGGIINEVPIEQWGFWIKAIFVFDLVYLMVPILLFDFIVEV